MEQEMNKCDFCNQIKSVERTYLHPSKYAKEQGAFINKTLYNEGDYFIIVKTCVDCGTPQLPQQEISDEEIEKAANGYFEGDLMWSERIAFKLAIKWYREQLKQKQ
jgi:hypothetical protein